MLQQRIAEQHDSRRAGDGGRQLQGGDAGGLWGWKNSPHLSVHDVGVHLRLRRLSR